MVKNSPICRIGCAGWNLPKDFRISKLSYLEQYAQIFNCVEINSSFYRHHQPKTYARWASVVPNNFQFSIKLPKTLTHANQVATPILVRFIDEIRELGSKLGPLLVQFPPSAVFHGPTMYEFFSAVRRYFDGCVVCEPRHSSWFQSDTSQMIKVFSLSFVGADPKPTENAPDIFNHPEIRYYRLHGSPKIYYSEYSDDFLKSFRSLRALRDPNTWVVFDNTALGYAFHNALNLSAYCQKEISENQAGKISKSIVNTF